jgi:hypothetical protein
MSDSDGEADMIDQYPRSATPQQTAELAELAAELVRTAGEASAALDRALEECAVTRAQLQSRPLHPGRVVGAE